MPGMKLEEAAALLLLHRADWDDGSLDDLAVFGSVARGEAREDSDVDVMLTFGRPVGLLHLVRCKLAFEEILGRRVDVVTPRGLHGDLREDVLEDAVSVLGDLPVHKQEARRKRWRWRLENVLAALEKTRRYTEGLDYAAFLRRELVRDAVLHNLMLAGENVNYLPPDLKLLHPELPWEGLHQVRHLIAHEYFGLDLELVWHTVRAELPPLLPLLARVLEKEAQKNLPERGRPGSGKFRP